MITVMYNEKKEAGMNKGRITVWCKIVSILSIITCLIVLIMVTTKPTLRELRQEEIRPMLNRFTGRDLPSEVEDLRAIFHSYRRIEQIFLAFKTDKEGCSYILDVFDGQDVKREESPNDKYSQFEWCHGISNGFRYQEMLGMNLFDTDLLYRLQFGGLEYIGTGHYPKDAVTACYLEFDANHAGGYEVLVFTDLRTVYIYAVRDLVEEDKQRY